MSKKRDTKIRTITESRVVDADGQLTSMITSEEERTIDGDGNTEFRRNYESVELADGTVYNPAMSTGKDPTVLTAVCGVCRKLFNKEAGVRCQKCSVLLCPTDACRSDDKHWCRRHYSRHRFVRGLGTVARVMFWKKAR